MNYRAPGTWLIVPFASVTLGCGLLRFTVEEQASTTVEGAGLLGTLLEALDFTGLDDFDLTIEQEMADQGVEEGELRSVVLTTLELSAEPDLSFLETMDVYVEADGVAPILVATTGSFPQGESTVLLEVTGEDILEAVVAGAMTFRLDVTGSAPEDDTQVDARVEVEIAANPKAACR